MNRTRLSTCRPLLRRALTSALAAAPALAATVALAALVLVAAGCSGYRSSRQAQIAAATGNWDEAVLHYMKAVEEDPGSIQHRAALLRARISASQQHFEKGKRYKEAGVLDRALIELQQAVQLDPTNQYAESELANVRQHLAAEREGRQLDTLEELKKRTSGARPQPPQLDPRSDKPISLNFPEPTSIFQIYRALGKAFGINVLFDPNLKDVEIPIELEDVTAQSALETLMRAAGHFYKVQDEHTIIIAADTPQNRRTYEDLVIQTFFLSNAEVKDMMTILRSLVDARKIATNEQLNAIILRDTADKVKVAERIIESNDKAKAEVVINVELMQLDSTKLRDLGVSLDPYSITQSLDTGVENNVLRLSDIEFLNQNNWTLTIPNFLYTFIKQSSEAQLLARPQLRITEGEQARLVIGDRIPIPVTTFNTANTVGGNIVPITSFQYQEVGITIEIEPRVHHNKEITLKVRVEVSNLSGFIEGSGGQQQPRIGTRTIDSVIRLKDGETNFLAGLLRTDESKNESGVPGLSDIPVLGQLFSSRSGNRSRTDVILTLTPHIVRNAEITELDLLPIWVGTEANITFRGGSPRVESDVEGPFDADDRSPEELQELMRRRIQQLPRGLRQEGDDGVGKPEEEPAPSGIDLVPQTGGRSRGPASGSGFIDREDADDAGQELPEGVNDDTIDSEAGGFRPNVSVLPGAGGPAGDRGPAGEGRAAGEVRLASLSAAAQSQAASAAPETESEAVVAVPAPDVRLRLVPRNLVAAPGDTFEVRLLADAARPVSHLPLVLEYDPAVLAVEKVEAGSFLGSESESQLLADRSQPGRLTLGASRLGQVPGVDGEGTVLRITFRGLAEGSASLTFAEAAARDAGLEPLTVAAAGAQVVVDAAAGAPLPPRRDPEVLEGGRPRRPTGPDA